MNLPKFKTKLLKVEVYLLCECIVLNKEPNLMTLIQLPVRISVHKKLINKRYNESSRITFTASEAALVYTMLLNYSVERLGPLEGLKNEIDQFLVNHNLI